jgi:hypothetical protein
MDLNHIVGNAGAIFASVFVVAACTMKTMIPLRVFAIITNIVLLNYSLLTHSYFPAAAHLIMLPINGYRLYEMMRLVRNVKTAVTGDMSMDWLKPFMKKERFVRGDILFHKGEEAKEMFYVVRGRFRLIESGIDILPGALVGELGMLSPTNQRTQTMECIEDGEMLKVTYQEVEMLYFQNPEFGFYFLRLATARLFHNINQLEYRLANPTEAASGAGR